MIKSVCMPTSINQVFHSKCQQEYGEQSCKEQKAKQEEQQSKKKEHAIAIEIEVPGGAEGINRVQCPNKQTDAKKCVKQAMQELQEEQRWT